MAKNLGVDNFPLQWLQWANWELYKVLRENENLKSDKVQTLKNLDEKSLKISETLDFDKEFKKRQNEYLKFVTEDNSFIKAALNFEATLFLDE